MLFAMTIDPESLSMFDYLSPQQIIIFWVLQVGILSGIALVAAYGYSVFCHRNPVVAFQRTLLALKEGVIEIVTLPLGMRRVWAIAMLSIKEALRRRILYVFILFLTPFLFAGWYLPNNPEGKLLHLVAFVNGAMTWLLLPLVVFLVSMSLPNDLQQRTIQTVVTKPIRRIEIVLGRVLGFMVIFTGVIAVMGTVSLLYLISQVPDDLKAQQWKARVPIYARPLGNDPNDLTTRPMYFVKEGVVQDKGTNVGKEWSYRSHIEGATGDACHWNFDFDPSIFGDAKQARAELKFAIFKTTKGNPTREDDEQSGVWCLLEFSELQFDEATKRYTPRPVSNRVFRVNNNRINELTDIPIDLFRSGKVRVTAQCLTRAQFLGMATNDFYFLAGERSFEANFIKGLFSLWLKILLLTSVAVAASTVLKGFVTVLLTTMVYILGIFYSFMYGVARGDVLGGGPFESLIRLVTQENQVNQLEPTVPMRIVLALDVYLLKLLRQLTNVIPNLSTLDTTVYVAEGFDIPPLLLVRNGLIVLGYVVPCLIAGYFLLKNREVAV